jgi:hypothetical protein
MKLGNFLSTKNGLTGVGSIYIPGSFLLSSAGAVCRNLCGFATIGCSMNHRCENMENTKFIALNDHDTQNQLMSEPLNLLRQLHNALIRDGYPAFGQKGAVGQADH